MQILTWINFSSVCVCAWNIFLGLINLYLKVLSKTFTYETLSGARDLNFQAVSDLILAVNFQIKCSTLLNRKRKEEKDNESNLKID